MGGRQAAGRLFDSHPGLTAIIALNDPMAIGVIAVLRERGLRVPQDISVVGFNDIPAATDIHPQLTTVQLPMEQMGAAAAELVLDPQQQERRTVPIGTKLVIRESTAPPSRQSATVPSP
jgi:LacI family transcriptional regulator